MSIWKLFCSAKFTCNLCFIYVVEWADVIKFECWIFSCTFGIILYLGHVSCTAQVWIKRKLMHVSSICLSSSSVFFRSSPSTMNREKQNSEYFLAAYKSLATKTLFTWSGGLRSSGEGFFCFHALADTKQKKPTPLDRGPPLHVNRPLIYICE